MKNVALVAVFFSSVSVSAAPTVSKDIYDALRVQEMNITPEGLLGSVTFEKAVGGLSCQKVSVVVPNAVPAYSCSILLENRDDGAIYGAIDIQEVNVTPEGLAGSTTWEKSIGGLACQKSRVVYPGATPSYSCSVR